MKKIDSVVAKAPYVVLYLSHGMESSYHQTALSILTLYYHAKDDLDDTTVVVYTDNGGFFEKCFAEIDLRIEILTKEQIKDYMGDHNFIHRVKTFVIQDCFTKYKTNLLYLDGDTLFLRNPLKLIHSISPVRSIMNSDEYDMQDGGIHELQHWFDLRKAIKAHHFTLHGKDFKIPLATRMWNAGVLGISYENAPLLEDVISLTDQLYAECPLFNVEQFATSYVLQENMNVVSTEDYILHYCYGGLKKIINYHLALFFEQNKNKEIAVLSQLAFEFSQKVDTLPAPPEIVKSMTILDRVILRLQLVKEVALTGRLHNKWS